MKPTLREIVGKTLDSIVVGANDREPHQQLILVFDDGTQLELYGSQFSCAGGLDSGHAAAAAEAIEKAGGRVTAIYGKE